MTQDRRTVLEMLAAGQITADEAERLLAALEAAPEEPAQPKKARYLRVVVAGDGRSEDSPRVNIRVPMRLLRAGVRLASLVPSQVHERVNRELQRHGVDLSQIRPENLEEIVNHLDDISVDVEDGARNAKVRIFAE
jgi:SHOCT-like protein